MTDYVEVATLQQALDLLDRWVRAYRRLEVEHENLQHRALHLEAAIGFDAVTLQEEESSSCPF